MNHSVMRVSKKMFTHRNTINYRVNKFINMTNIDIRDNMKEMFDNLENCKYSDCLHIKEDGCYVKQLVENKQILESRYNNYKTFINNK